MAWERSKDSPPGYYISSDHVSSPLDEKGNEERGETYMIFQISTNIHNTSLQDK